MQLLSQKTGTILALCLAATVMQGQGELPVEISPVTIPGTSGECENRQASHNLLINAMREIIYQIYGGPRPECGPGDWKRVFYLNASNPDQQSCPGDWNLVTSPIRGCTGVQEACRSVFSNDINAAYSKVCGKIIGDNIHTTDAFTGGNLEGNYVDGVSITYGEIGSRIHIWSFGAVGYVDGRCPCDTQAGPLPPAEVGNNYFCDRDDALDDLLWTGENCATDDPCCSFNNPPYFSVQLPAATTDRIEIRICTDQPELDESVLVLLAEIYVQ